MVLLLLVMLFCHIFGFNLLFVSFVSFYFLVYCSGFSFAFFSFTFSATFLDLMFLFIYCGLLF